MARICKTLVPEQGFAHRDHRSKKGQRKVKISERFDPEKLKPKIKLSEKLAEFDGDDLVKIINGKKFIKKEAVRKEIIKIADFKRYPKMVCENCGNTFRLNFDPRKDRIGNLLPNVICPHCHGYAHFTNYYTLGFIFIYFWVTDYVFVRDLIKQGKTRLINFL